MRDFHQAINMFQAEWVGTDKKYRMNTLQAEWVGTDK